MRTVVLTAVAVSILLMNISAQTPQQLAEIWEKQHVSKILPSNVRHKDLQNYLEGLRKHQIKVVEVGRSLANREIYQMEFGSGPMRVFLWSQMHGDEPTATSALIDMFTFLQKNRDKEWVKNIEKTMTIRAVPMLNPDGAELYVRRNLQGIDINRDALDLKTPEGNLLKKLRDEWSPAIGFNLHNQNALTTAGSTSEQAAISILVVYGDAQKTATDGLDRNKRLAAAMVSALNNFIPRNIARYDDEYTATAFGDNFSAWGTPVILIETGALYGKDEMFLVRMNFVAMMTALNDLANGSERSFDTSAYDALPRNSSGRIFNFVFRGANIIDRTKPSDPAVADIAINLERRRAEFPTPAIIRRVGKVSQAGIVEYDASGFIVVGRSSPIRPDSFGELLFYKKSRSVDWSSPELEKLSPPDAIFSVAKWVKGEGIVPVK
ncbi:MAG: M14 family zinc carboxypeptidase [Pyrinomonadaceae bacterium]